MQACYRLLLRPLVGPPSTHTVRYRSQLMLLSPLIASVLLSGQTFRGVKRRPHDRAKIGHQLSAAVYCRPKSCRPKKNIISRFALGLGTKFQRTVTCAWCSVLVISVGFVVVYSNTDEN